MNGALVQVPFIAGIDEKADPKQAKPGTLTNLENGVFSRAGEIAKRPGLDALPMVDTDGLALTALRVFSRGDSLCCLAADGYVYSWVDAANAWRKHDRAPELSASWSVVADAVASIAQPDVAYSAGYAIFVWRTGQERVATVGEVYVSVVELATGTRVVPATRLSTQGYTPRVIVEQGTVIIGWVEGTGAPRTLNACTVSLSAPFSISAATAIAANLSSECSWDMSAWQRSSGTSRIYWAWSVDGGGIQVQTTRPDFTGAVGPYNYGAPAADCTNISASAVPYPSDVLHIVYRVPGVSHRAGGFEFGGATTVADGLVGLGGGTETAACLAIDDDNALHVAGELVQTFKLSMPGVPDNAIVFDGVAIARPFKLGSRYYLACVPQRLGLTGGAIRNQKDSAMIVELPYPNETGVSLPALPAGNISPRIFGDQTLVAVSNVAVVSASEVLHVHGVSGDEFRSTQPGHQALNLVRISKTDASRWKSVEVLGSALFSGACPWWFDGQNTGDVGIVASTPTLASLSGGGSLTVGQPYLCGVIYEHQDANGVLHRSPLYTETVTIGVGHNAVNVTVRNVTVTSKEKRAGSFGAMASTYAAVYGSDAAGTLLYRFMRAPALNVIVNDPTVITTQTLVYTGNFPAGTRVQAYTTGSVLDDQAPPGFRDLCLHKGRVFGLSGDQRTLWFSQRISDEPQVFPGFNDALTLRVDDGADLVALASMDSVLVAFSDRGIYYLEGDGPGATGVPSDFGPLRRVNADVGCLDPRSVVSCAAGTLFQGTDGRIWLLTRGLELQPIGTPVEDTIAAYPVVVAAVLVETADQVRFSLLSSDGTTGVTLVWDYAVGQWAKFTYGAVASACLYRGRYVAAMVSGGVREESPTEHLDVGSWVTLRIETAWISTDAPQGWARVRRIQTLGEYRSAHGFTVELSVDHADEWLQTATFNESDVETNRDRASVSLGAQGGMSPRCKAFRVRITDTEPIVPASGEGACWSGFAAEVVPKAGLSRHGAAGSKR